MAQELTFLNDDDAEKLTDEIGERGLWLMEVRHILRRRQSKEMSAEAMQARLFENDPEGLERRVKLLSRELNIAVASLGGAEVRLGEVAEGLEDEWLFRAAIFACRDNIS